MRWLIRAILLAAVLYGGFLAVVYSKMTRPPLEFAAFWADVPALASRTVPFRPLWARARAGTLEIGDEAPDFELEYHDHSGKMRLSDLRGRPVVLAFGSYTWPPFRRQLPALNEMAAHYGDRVAFRMVYIAEAHSSDIWQVGANERDEVIYVNPKTMAERDEVAAACVRNLNVGFPAVVDGIDNAVEAAYTGWPDRLFVIDPEGKVVFKSGAGPFGFRPEGVKQALVGLVGE